MEIIAARIIANLAHQLIPSIDYLKSMINAMGKRISRMLM
ncbi:hypothetical protein HMPREF9997_00323 [Corynebacterium durum F0235]|uniref:Uncharacterized protein n=1 Tax=Corynebacterium durum F0235 TaxID=1035195 RepID=L1MM45_9CORY|nr:hypothetical protein HMPREF9997_00323 [Corynebacterium durum F0235]